MGNNGSSSRDQQQAASMCSNGLLMSETSRGWSQSFPRELARHRSQPTAARKVLPEPPNQRLRATDNGCIIHNGGTISGRRPSTFASPRDLDKQHDGVAPFRGRSITMSNVAESRPRRTAERHCCRYQVDSGRTEATSPPSDLKRFGSEPDLRYSPDAGSSIQDRSSLGKPSDREDERSTSYRRTDREAKDRAESRYKARKKYKAPAPPRLLDSDNHLSSVEPRFRVEREVQPPPRKSRLFKTRAETKKAQVSWQLSGCNRSFDCDRERIPNDPMDVEQQGERVSDRRCRTRNHFDKDTTSNEWQERDPVRRPNQHRQHTRLLDGKNTLQRSLSSPEFQAELIQVARKVRDKLDCTRRTIGESTADFRSLDHRGDGSDARARDCSFEKGSERVEGSPVIASAVDSFTEQRDAIGCVSPNARNRSGHWKTRGPPMVADEAKTGIGEQSKISRDAKASSVDRDGTRQPQPLRERLEAVQVRARLERKDADRRRRVDEPGKYGKYGKHVEAVPKEIARNVANAEAPNARLAKDARENRGWTSETTPTDALDKLERQTRDKENSDPRWWNDDKRVVAEEWKSEPIFRDTTAAEANALGQHRREDGPPFVSLAQTAPKTFYFGMNEILLTETRNDEDLRLRKEEMRITSTLRNGEDGRSSADTADDADENGRNVIEDISLKLRPTLPKKQLEIPRFSPSAAWRLLSALEAPGPSLSTASEEMPVMLEERIERMSRPPPPLLALGPRSLHDKSGDSGISGDAGAANEDTLDVSTINRMKTPATRPTWTPQQDLGEESSSDAGVDSPPPLPASLKYPPRAHVFSLSLPREDARTYLCSSETKAREGSAFNSLKKLKRSVSGAFGIGVHDVQRKRTHDVLDDNWLLSTSAPTSLQHNQIVETTRVSACVWKPFAGRERVIRREDEGNADGNSNDDNRSNDCNGNKDNGLRDDDDDDDVDDDDDDDDDYDDDDDDDDDGQDIAEDEREEEDTDGDAEVEDDGSEEKTSTGKVNDFPAILKPPSFSYLAPGGHVMYLPESNEAEHRVQSLNGRKVGLIGENHSKETGTIAGTDFSRFSDEAISMKRRSDDSRPCISVKNSRGAGELSRFRESCKNPPRDNVPASKETLLDAKETKPRLKNSSKSRRFTFQSTVRQIERRRLAEKLSREAEAKERQRKGELEAMRKVEEEFQRKRAKEKASIRQQLRLFKEMEENFNLPPAPVQWDGSQLSRADPDGAPSSTTSSPTWLPAGQLPANPGKGPASNEGSRTKKGAVGSRSGVGSASASPSASASHSASASASASTLDPKQRRGERKAYRPKYYDWAPDSSLHLEYKQTTVHPKIVCDIPKSSPVFVHVNPVHPAKPAISNTTPRSDNYRKDFAHGTVIARSSFASSDSELSQPNTRPHSRRTGIKSKPHRSRSASPERREDAAISDQEILLGPAKSATNPAHDFLLSGVQPFTKEKTYRPISFNPQPPPLIPS
ncbi:uncharacterized protein LOC143368250 isoform X3 [Andrena cerasifolii]|uniref:uncharacterized protein LOC143368250 isoform X3 n=1 Tax=Andrena cerasifolii TaxID=2819439 RepID=UPI004037C7DC